MNFLLDPNVAYLLLVSGLLLAVLALFSPGTGILEIGAFFMIVLAGYSISTQPVNLWALGILLLSLVAFVIALRRTKQPIFLLLSLLALIVGSIFLFQGQEGQWWGVHPLLAVVISTLALGILWIIGRKTLEASRRPAADLKHLIGMKGTARTDIFRQGSVYVDGEEWSARSDVFIPAGAGIQVIGREGLVLLIKSFEPNQQL